MDKMDVKIWGAAQEQARVAVILVHGRGATADSMRSLADVFMKPGFRFYAPQAVNYSWYPYSFLAPTAQNEPFLSQSLGVIRSLIESVQSQGIASEKIVLMGFSQGGCLALETAARNATRFGAVVGFSAGLIGPDVSASRFQPKMAGTPVFLGCSDVDSHIPLVRVNESAQIFADLGAQVTKRIYPGMGHTIIADEIGIVDGMLRDL